MGMANTIKKGESLFIPFKNGESIYDSQIKPRMYKTKEQYDRFSYRFDDAEMVEYAEVVRCKECKHWGGVIYGGRCKQWSAPLAGVTHFTSADDFCSYGERKDND